MDALKFRRFQEDDVNKGSSISKLELYYASLHYSKSSTIENSVEKIKKIKKVVDLNPTSGCIVILLVVN